MYYIYIVWSSYNIIANACLNFYALLCVTVGHESNFLNVLNNSSTSHLYNIRCLQLVFRLAMCLGLWELAMLQISFIVLFLSKSLY